MRHNASVQRVLNCSNSVHLDEIDRNIIIIVIFMPCKKHCSNAPGLGFKRKEIDAEATGDDLCHSYDYYTVGLGPFKWRRIQRMLVRMIYKIIFYFPHLLIRNMISQFFINLLWLERPEFSI